MRCTPDSKSLYHAKTFYKTTWNLTKGDDGVIYLESYVYFIKNKSWVKNETDYLLSHEQLHFDIAELYNRKFKKAVSEIKFETKKIEETIPNIFLRFNKERIKNQNLYDEETRHGESKVQQEIWIKKINNELKNFELYSNNVVIKK